ncbi:signal recognition particle protein, partial [Candidatus Falkowbacteria bacterium]|nr:signal recognition particle protein [Candidatus Falkowbacteria bacterium]
AKERRNPELIKASRKKRIAAGSGTTVPEINRLLKQHEQMSMVMKRIKKMGGRKGLMNLLKDMDGPEGPDMGALARALGGPATPGGLPPRLATRGGKRKR